jgi:hypothetical protein
MGKVHKEHFLYMYTGELENAEIQKLIRDGIKNYAPKRKFKLIVNVVEDKFKKKRGYSFGWISDKFLFYALVGKNEDGSSRVTFEDDPDWSEPEEESETLELGSELKWGESVWSECPKIRIEQPPLISTSPYMGKDKEEHTIDIFETTCDDIFTDRNTKKVYMLKNEIYSLKIPKCITEEFLYDKISKFCQDTSEHKIKKKGKKKEYITVVYPQINININSSEERSCQIIFSPLDKNLAQFVLTMSKKMFYGKKDHENIFFSQPKKN